MWHQLPALFVPLELLCTQDSAIAAKGSPGAPVTTNPASAMSIRTHQRSLAGLSQPGSVRRRAGWSGENTSAPVLISTFPTGTGQWGSIALADLTLHMDWGMEKMSQPGEEPWVCH